MIMKKHTFYVFVVFCMIFTLLPVAVLADESSNVVGDFTVVGDDGSYSYDAPTLYITNNEPLIISGTTIRHNIVVENDINANLTLSDLSIDVSGISGCALDISENSAISLTIVGDNTLKSGGNCAGLRVASDSEVMVHGTNSDYLVAIGGMNGGAGIGG